MGQRKIQLTEATTEQLRTFAQKTLGIPIHPNTKHEKVLAQVQAAYHQAEFTVEEPDAPTAQDGAPPRPATAAQAAPPSDKVRIRINITEEPGGSEPVPVGVNGSVMLIPRDKDVEIPRPYYEALMHAEKHQYEMMPDGLSVNPVPRRVPMYPVTRLA